MTSDRRAMLMMCAFVGLWAVIEAIAAQVLSDYSPYQVVFVRYVVHLGCMIAICGLRDPASLCRTSRPLYQVARSLLMLVMPASWVLALQHGVEPGALMSIFWASPLLILAFAALMLGERAPITLWLTTGLAFIGALLVIRPGPTSWSPALVFPLAMAVSFSLYVAMTRSLRSETTRANLFYTALGVAIALAPFMPALWKPPTLQALLVMVSVGVLGCAALFAVDRMAAQAPVSVVATFAFLQLAFTVAIDGAVNHARPGRLALVGIAVVVGAAVLVWSRRPVSFEERHA